MLSISLSGAFNLPELSRNPWLEPAVGPQPPANQSFHQDGCQWSPEALQGCYGNGNSLTGGTSNLLQGLQDIFGSSNQGGEGGQGGQGGEGGAGATESTRERTRIRKGKNKTTKKTRKSKKSSPGGAGGAGGAGGQGGAGGSAPAGGSKPSGGTAPVGGTKPPNSGSKPPSSGARPPSSGMKPPSSGTRPPSSGAPSASSKPSSGRPTASANGQTVSATPSSGRGPMTPAFHPNRPMGAPIHPALSGRPLGSGSSAPTRQGAPSGSPAGSPGGLGAPSGTSPSNLPPGQGKVGSLGPQMDRWDGDILREAEKWGVPPENLKALIALESEGNPNAHQVNPTYGDTHGLGQINAAIWGDEARRLGYDLNSPEGQIGMAAYLLRQGYEERGSWDGAHNWYFNPSGTGDSVNGTSNAGYIDKIHQLIGQMGGYQ